MDLIDRDAVLSEINEEVDANQEYPEDKLIRKGLRIARKIIENAPIVNRWVPCSERLPEQEVRHGRWIPIEYDSYADGAPVWDKWECSECGHGHEGEEDTLTPFCPNCGARMDAAKEDSEDDSTRID